MVQGNKEFISLMALLMSLVALTIDAMLPALSQIGDDLNVTNPNDVQLVVSTVFLGMALGLMLYGPISDSYGRKRAIYLGIVIFLVGSLISSLSTNFTLMLVGRVIQGFGAAACRVVTLAMIRDNFSGKEMGRVMSLIMMIFIMVPALAPSLGQLVLLVAEWRVIFWLIFLLALAGLLWLYFRQEETLDEDSRIPFSFENIISGVRETLKNPFTRGYTIASGLMFGAFVGYLSTAQQILQVQYQLGDLFSLYFGCLALAIGCSSFVNSHLVMRYPMETLCLVSLSALSVISLAFYGYIEFYLMPAKSVGTVAQPTLLALMVYLAAVFFCFGILFGNFNTLAVHPLGHIAGVATSVISSVQTLLSVVIGGLIGQCYNGTIQPLVSGFLVCGVLTLSITLYLHFKTPET